MARITLEMEFATWLQTSNPGGDGNQGRIGASRDYTIQLAEYIPGLADCVRAGESKWTRSIEARWRNGKIKRTMLSVYKKHEYNIAFTARKTGVELSVGAMGPFEFVKQREYEGTKNQPISGRYVVSADGGSDYIELDIST